MSPGKVMAGRYELGERLGTGGMSTVQIAFDRRLERDVAIKLLAEHLAEDSQFVARFRREALAAARLVHPNIVQVFDFGLDAESDRHYIVMEYIRGQSCAEILRDRGHLPVGEALDIVTQACRGLDYAHRNGVVHRDVKPGNLLRSTENVVKLADFGIAKALSDESSITQAGSVLGTAAYLAPEQASGEEAGPRADIYALGVVTYQLLAGRLPYDAASLTELALMQQHETPPSLDTLNPEVVPQLAAAVDRALALDPRDRWETAEAMREGLSDGARGIGPEVTEATRIVTLGTDDTGATGVVAPRSRTTEFAAGPVPSRARQPLPSRRAAPVPAPAPVVAHTRGRAPSRRRGRARRLIGTLLVLALLGAGIAAAVAATSNSGQAVRLRKVVYNDVNRVVDQMKQLVNDNTK